MSNVKNLRNIRDCECDGDHEEVDKLDLAIVDYKWEEFISKHATGIIKMYSKIACNHKFMRCIL